MASAKKFEFDQQECLVLGLLDKLKVITVVSCIYDVVIDFIGLFYLINEGSSIIHTRMYILTDIFTSL